MNDVFKVIIAGSRDFNNYRLLKEKCDKILQNKSNIEIVSGTSRGADLLGEKYAKENNYIINRFPANWNHYGKSAGYLRNKQMAEYGDALICFWDGKSRGTLHMINLAQEYNLQIRIIKYDSI